MARKIEGNLYQIRMASGDSWLVEARYNEIYDYIADLYLSEKYYVLHDNQGGTFGTERDFTIGGWRDQAIEWAETDENYGLRDEIFALPKSKVLDCISEYWDIEFAKSKIQSVYWLTPECKWYRMQMLTSKEFKEALKKKKHAQNL